MNWLESLSLQRFRNYGGVSQRVLIALALVLVIGGGLFLYFGSSSTGVNVEVILPEGPVLVGVPFEVEAHFTNDSQSKLTNVRLALSLPEGIALFEDGQKVNVVRELDDARPGSVAKEKFVLIAFPADDKSAHKLVVSATYSAGSLSAEFSESEEKEVDVRERDVDFDVSMPDTIFVGQEFQVGVSYKNVVGPEYENQEVPTLALRLEGSQDITVTASDPGLSDGEGEWLLGRGEDNEISFRGRVSTKSEDVFVLKGQVILEFADETYVLKEKEFETFIAPSPLSFSISLADPKDFAFPGELLRYNVRYRNNTDADLKDVVIKTQLVGEMFDIGTLDADASYNSLSRTVSWTSAKFSRLREVRKGDEGTFSFSIKVVQDFPADKNLVLKAKSTIESPTITQGLSTDRTASSDLVETKVAGVVDVETKAYFRDAASGVLNQGPLPPKAGQPTDYSIHFEVAGYGNDLGDVVVRTRLEKGVVFEKLVESNIESAPEYNSATREVVWRLGDMPVSAGAVAEKPKAVFQVEATPENSMIGEYMPLLEITTASAVDKFAGVDLVGADDPVTTRLSDDPSVDDNEGRVTN